MIINTDVYNEVFRVLKQFVKDNTDYDVYVTKLPLQQSDKFPQVVLTEEENSFNSGTTRGEETVSKLSYEVNIYAQDKVVNGDMKSRVDIARELVALVDNVMNCNYRMRRITCRPTPNIDINIYRMTLRYTVSLNDNRIKFI